MAVRQHSNSVRATRCTPPQPAKSTRTACACDTKRIARALSANGEGSRSWSISSLSFPLYFHLSDPYLPLPQISPFAPLQYPSGNHHVSVVLTGCRRPLPAGLRSRLSRSDGRAVPNRSTPISSRSCVLEFTGFYDVYYDALREELWTSARLAKTGLLRYPRGLCSAGLGRTTSRQACVRGLPSRRCVP